MGLARSDSESQALVRERLAGLEKEVPLLRQDNDRLRNEMSQLRTYFDEKWEGQQRYIDRKFAELQASVSTLRNGPPPTAILDSRIYIMIIGIGVAVAVLLVLSISALLQSHGITP